jgi:hypothetical protein
MFALSLHAERQLESRGIPKQLVLDVCTHPGQQWETANGQRICQSLVAHPSGETFLLRVFINTRKAPNLIITAYWTSKVAKYWKHEGDL